MIWSDATLRSSTAAEPHAFLAYVIAFVTAALEPLLLSVSAMARPVMVFVCRRVPVKLVASAVPAVAWAATTQLLLSNVAAGGGTGGVVQPVLKLFAGAPTPPPPEDRGREHVDNGVALEGTGTPT